MSGGLDSVVTREGEHLVIPPGALVFYVDDSGDPRLADPDHPFLAFGGVALTSEFHTTLADNWRRMKAATFPRIQGPLHAKRHMRKRTVPRWAAVCAAMTSPHLGRFGAILTDATSVAPDLVAHAALRTLANRFADIAQGMLARALWHPPDPIYAIFEHSTVLAGQIERAFDGIAIEVGPYRAPIEGCFMPKSVANPFLEMADCVANATAKNVKYQREQNSPLLCTPTFQSLFRDPGPPLASYIEVTAVT